MEEAGSSDPAAERKSLNRAGSYRASLRYKYLELQLYKLRFAALFHYDAEIGGIFCTASCHCSFSLQIQLLNMIVLKTS